MKACLEGESKERGERKESILGEKENRNAIHVYV
jgi:hypothetical protein